MESRDAILAIALFSDLPLQEVEELAAAATLVEVRPGDAVTREGHSADAWFAVIRGRHRAGRTRPDGGQAWLGAFHPGSLVGLEGVCGPGRYALTVGALEPGLLLRFPGALLDRTASPQLALALRERVTWALDGWLRLLGERLSAEDEEARRWTLPP